MGRVGIYPVRVWCLRVRVQCGKTQPAVYPCSTLVTPALVHVTPAVVRVHQSKYPHYDVTLYIHQGHCNVHLYKGPGNIVMWQI
jgi:hypothetical protein